MPAKQVSYAHKNSPKGPRYVQYESRSVPSWATDVRPYTPLDPTVFGYQWPMESGVQVRLTRVSKNRVSNAFEPHAGDNVVVTRGDLIALLDAYESLRSNHAC